MGFSMARRLLSLAGMQDKRNKARARALRAARVVSIAAALVIGPTACSTSHGPAEPPPPMGDASTPDTGPVDPPDTGLPDTGPIAYDGGHDAGMMCPEPTWTDCCETTISRECCETTFGFWDESANCCVTCVEGPMVPPSAPV